VLAKHEVDNVHEFIKSLLSYDISSTQKLVFAEISALKLVERRDVSSRRWFQQWWKNSQLHNIMIKSLAVVRYSATQKQDVMNWFHDYRHILQELTITHSRRIWNFHEADFRLKYMKDQNIVMSDDISKFYAISSKNRKFLTVIKAVNAADHKLISSCLIIHDQELMKNWSQSGLSAKTLIKTSSSEFINDEIVIEWLKHFIQHTKSEEDNSF
jgi:hypothetical protein